MCSRRVSVSRVQSIASYPISCLWLCRVCVHVCVACWSTLFYISLSVFTHAPSSKGHAAVSVYLHCLLPKLNVYVSRGRQSITMYVYVHSRVKVLSHVRQSVCLSIRQKSHCWQFRQSSNSYTWPWQGFFLSHSGWKRLKQFAFPPFHIWVSGLS